MQWGWYLQAICEHLQAVTEGKIRKLAISLPPNTLKSFFVSVCWPAWQWATNPGVRFLVAANDGPLATRDALAMRSLVESDWYTEHFRSPKSVAGEWKLAPDQAEKTWFVTTKGGHRISYSVNARVTGKKGDVLIVDDANDARKVHSKAERDNVIRWHDDAFSGRMADEKTSPEVIVGQRTHKDDLIGHCLRKPGWVQLRLPERYNPDRRCVTPIGHSDPRTAIGELLRPARFGEKEVADRIGTLGSVGFLTQHDQEPPEHVDGNRFKKHWFRDRWQLRGENIVLRREGEAQGYEVRWQNCVRFGTCDGATSAKTDACHTVVGAWLLTPRNDLVWLDCDRFQAEIPDQPPRIEAMVARWKLAYMGIEAVLSNVGLFQIMSRTSMTVKRLDPLGEDKLVRATQALVLAEAGRIWLPAPGARPTFPLAEVEGELWLWTGLDPKEPSDVIDCLSYAAKIRADCPSTDPRDAMPLIMGGPRR
ncbi:Phage terminase, large subunit [Frigoriglobus tundricola]|uniref:Phage terminase, large subunit n=1 Tax=Frigoriglobus tundricola TaxID=2774151 RepID=A0A6M5Z6D5_9BACT|nr:Phage terminase, large subunit [Frigoriglobus tundricola]